MHVVPVIDIRFGLAVKAVAGERSSYRPLATPYASGSNPVDVAAGLVNAFGFDTLYLADLDAIEGRGMNVRLLTDIAAALPNVSLWVDSGGLPIVPTPWTTVLGSESLTSLDAYLSLEPTEPERSFVLSLDFRHDGVVGPRELLDVPHLWPPRVIVMTLARVGLHRGPDVARVENVAAKAGPQRSVYAAGGVRDAADLRALNEAGAGGALVASALHAGTIKPADVLTSTGS